MKNWLMLSLIIGLTCLETIAQTAQDSVPMADQFREDGKIYVVVVIMLIIVLGLCLYAYRMDRKIGSLEKTVKEKH